MKTPPTIMTTNSWPYGVFDCFQSPNRGPTCFLAHCCFQPCVWSSALEYIEVSNSSLLGLALCCGGRGVLDEFAGYVGRRAVLKKYDIRERDLTTGCIACLLGPCGRIQEVDTIVKNEGLKYQLLSVVKPRPLPPSVPIQATMVRTLPRFSSRV